MIDKIKRLYETSLLPGEEIVQVRPATAVGTGSTVATGAIIGALLGWLAAINLDSALLPLFVFGALVGEAVAYLVAERAARRPDGPGTIHLIVALTDQRLLTLPRFAARRRRLLRHYDLRNLRAVHAKQYPIGQLHRVEISLANGTTTGFITQGALDIPVISDPGSG